MGCLAGAFLQFNPALAEGPMPSAYITGVGGNQNASICSPVGGATPGTATADFTGGNVTWIGNNLTIGVSGSSAGIGTAANGTLSFNNGLVDFNTILVGFQSVSGGATATGTINIGSNATLQVNTKLTLGATTGAINPATSGTINLLDGNATLQASTITNGGAGSTVNMSNANWSVALTSTSVTNMTVSNFTALGSTNIIIIASITPFLGGTPPLRFHLIATSTSANLVGPSTLGVTLPASYNPSIPYGGYLDYTTTPGLVDFVLTNAPPLARQLTWTGTNAGGGTNTIDGPDGDWDVAITTNWLVSGVATAYNQFDLATFNDIPSTADTNINLTTTITPYSITVNNAASLYTIGGSGNLSGATGLTKQGTGTLILDNTSANNFTGGVTISGGMLQIGNGDMQGNLPAVPITDNGILADARMDSVIMNTVISGTGALVSAGGGTLQLAAPNSFTGNALATNSSTLQFGSATAVGSVWFCRHCQRLNAGCRWVQLQQECHRLRNGRRRRRRRDH